MDLNITVTLLVIGAIVVGLLQERIGPEVVMFAGLVLLTLFGVIRLDKAISGFANESVVGLGSLFVIGAGLRTSGAMEIVGQALLGRRNRDMSFLRLFAPIAVLSAFINNTPLVSVMLPIYVQWAKRCRVSPSKVLMIVSFSALLGGTCTLVGTSTNLVVHEFVRHSEGSAGLGLGMFELAWIGVPTAVIGLAYLGTFGRRLLPDRQDLLEHLRENPREYSVELMVLPNCPLVGRSIQDAGLRDLPGLYIYSIERSSAVISPVSSRFVLMAGDVLLLTGVVSSVVDLQKIRGLEPVDHLEELPMTVSASEDESQGFSTELQPRWKAAPRKGHQLCEVVISSSSPLIGQSIKDSNFRAAYDASVVAVHRSGARLDNKIGMIVLEAGDALLIDSGQDFVNRWRNSPDFILVAGIEDTAPVAHERSWIAIALFIGVIAGMSLMPLFGRSAMLAPLIGAPLMIFTGCLRSGQLARAIESQLLILIASSIGVGNALEQSGTARWLAESFLQSFHNSGPISVMIAIYLLTCLLTQFLSNNATAAIMGSLALAAATHVGASPRPFLIAVCVAASNSFLLPIDQTNLLVRSAGGYKFIDFVRVGLPLTMIVMLTSFVIIPIVWPF